MPQFESETKIVNGCFGGGRDGKRGDGREGGREGGGEGWMDGWEGWDGMDGKGRIGVGESLKW